MRAVRKLFTFAYGTLFVQVPIIYIIGANFSPQRPRSSPAIGRLTPAHFDDPVRVSHAAKDNRQHWLVAWRCEVGFLVIISAPLPPDPIVMLPADGIRCDRT